MQMTKFNRRAILVGAGASLAGAAVAVTAMTPTHLNGSEHIETLPALITAHQEANEAYNRAIDAEGEINSRINERVGFEKVLTPVSFAADGSPARGGKVEVRFHDRGASAREHIVAFHENLRRSHCGDSWASSVVPGHAERMAMAVAAAEARALDALAGVVATYEHLLIAEGSPSAEEETRCACVAETNALAAVWLYRPKTDGERAIKRDYLATIERRFGDTSQDDMTVAAIISLLRDEVAA